ncbi:MAG: 4Fe-4S dicluster domain-containing protein [Trueperaceae bacterium]|nr:MAG: 4Fe-4S dicluster domain-containing protein [Trueperaceae bacterium]
MSTRLRRGQAPTRRMAHIWDASRCIACGACVMACTQANAPEMMFREEKGWKSLASNIRRIDGVSPHGRPELLLVQCQHCENAPCISTCPFGATYYDTDGRVRLDPARCAGCSYCVTSCPYNVRWLHPDNKLPKKCMGDGCIDLTDSGQQPACVQACPAMARDYGDLNDPASSVSVTLRTKRSRRLLEATGSEPKFFVVEGSR